MIDFDEIWYSDTYWPPTGGRHLENQKWRYLRNGVTDLYEVWYGDAKWVSLRPLKNSLSKIQDGGQLPF